MKKRNGYVFELNYKIFFTPLTSIKSENAIYLFTKIIVFKSRSYCDFSLNELYFIKYSFLSKYPSFLPNYFVLGDCFGENL